MHASTHVSTHASVHAYLQTILKQRAADSYTFRYPTELLKKLDALHYTLYVELGAKLPKNTIAVLGLAYVLLDLEEKKEDSDFYKLLTED